MNQGASNGAGESGAWTREESEAWSKRIARSALPTDTLPTDTLPSTSPTSTSSPSSGDMQLEERTALRRVAGLSTELADVTEVEYRQLRLERVVLVGVWTTGSSAQAESSMAELAETAGSEVLDALVQRRDKPDSATYIGSGKAHELRDVVLATGADTVVCDGELTPAQLNALEKVVKVKVIDRTALILDIFAQHATSREGKAQVAFAQMEYMLPRLRGWGESMSRQAAWVCVGPVKPRSRPIVVVSASAWQSCVARSKV